MKIEKNALKVKRTKQNLIVFLILICIVIPVVSQAQLLNYPQKIVIDVERNRLLVSNFGNGALVQIDANSIQDTFITNAGFVDGMDIVGNVVYGVGHNRKLYGYDLDTKQQVLDFTFPGAGGNYLSSVASDSTGHLFISCPALHAIYKFCLSDSSYWVFAQGNGLNRPNGIWLERENDRIVVIDDSPATSIIHAISLSDSTVSDLLTTNLDRPDGIVRDVNGIYYIGGYYLPGLYRIDADFSEDPEMFFAGNNMVYPTYDPSDHSLLITYYHAHDWGRVMLGAGIEEQTMLPNSIELFQNYPNPFNPETTISFSVDQHSKVNIDIFNINGKKVSNLTNSQFQTGNHKIIWKGIDDNGKKVSSGLYFYKMKINGLITVTRKMILLK